MLEVAVFPALRTVIRAILGHHYLATIDTSPVDFIFSHDKFSFLFD
jgi:hypothetical protein